jgi:hypothetical protein
MEPVSQPDGIIITISKSLIKQRGYRVWLQDFMAAMEGVDQGSTYWLRLGNVPTKDVLYVYLCIGNRIRFRATFVSSSGPRFIEFDDGRKMAGNAWVCMCGPVVKAPGMFPRKGFQGFRYCEKLF